MARPQRYAEWRSWTRCLAVMHPDNNANAAVPASLLLLPPRADCHISLPAAPHTDPSIGSEPRHPRAHGFLSFVQRSPPQRPHSPTKSWPMARWTIDSLPQRSVPKKRFANSLGACHSPASRKPFEALLSPHRDPPRQPSRPLPLFSLHWPPFRAGLTCPQAACLLACLSAQPAAAVLQQGSSSSACRATAIWQQSACHLCLSCTCACATTRFGIDGRHLSHHGQPCRTQFLCPCPSHFRLPAE